MAFLLGQVQSGATLGPGSRREATGASGEHRVAGAELRGDRQLPGRAGEKQPFPRNYRAET